jgi:NAD(P)-dependent dehydrogenase (short-subunit alcohol dehydrogenase family)
MTDAAQIQAAVGKAHSLDVLIHNANAGIARFDDLSDRAVLEQRLRSTCSAHMA